LRCSFHNEAYYEISFWAVVTLAMLFVGIAFIPDRKQRWDYVILPVVLIAVLVLFLFTTHCG